MSIGLRFIDIDTDNIVEAFLMLTDLCDVTAKGLTDSLLSGANTMKLRMEKCRGIGLDGARVMSGRKSGVSAMVREKFPLVTYVHCFSHRLNLVIGESCKVKQITLCLGTIKSIYNFLNSPKKQVEFGKSIEKTTPETARRKLKNTCETRWIERHEAVNTFFELFEPTIDVLNVISEWSNNEDNVKAQGFLNTVSTFDFIITLVTLKFVFNFILPLSRLLQSPSIDYSTAIASANDLIEKLETVTENSKEHFQTLFKEASDVASCFEIEITLPKNKGRPRLDGINQQPVEFYYSCLFIPLLNSVSRELKEKFRENAVLANFKNIMFNPEWLLSREVQNSLMHLYHFYVEDLNGSLQMFFGEVEMWQKRLGNATVKPRTSMEHLKTCPQEMFPNVFRLLKIYNVIPITTADVERSFSKMKQLKTDDRNTTGEERLNGLMFLSIHRDTEVNFEEFIYEFRKGKRRLDV